MVAALKEHPSLLEKHFSRLTDEYYQDQTLHLLAFDLMYCSRAYNFYRGLIVPSTRRTTRKKNEASVLTPEEIARREEERLARIDEIEQEITELELSCAEYADISLIGVQVTANIYGIGTVVEQKINKIKVRFDETEKTFMLDKKYLSRPRFENDDVVVEAFTEYGKKKEQIDRLERELSDLQK